jgi:hypothetical protein
MKKINLLYLFLMIKLCVYYLNALNFIYVYIIFSNKKENYNRSQIDFVLECKIKRI